MADRNRCGRIRFRREPVVEQGTKEYDTRKLIPLQLINCRLNKPYDISETSDDDLRSIGSGQEQEMAFIRGGNWMDQFQFGTEIQMPRVFRR